MPPSGFAAGRTRDLDFIVIGVQKGGTTSLWEQLRHHPQIAMPAFKEAPVFTRDAKEIPGALAKLIESDLGGAPSESLLGKAATYYMMGQPSADVDLVAERIAATWPQVRLIALLRDPIERAMSHYRMLVRRGAEVRPFETVVEEQMTPQGVEAGRARPNRTNTYLAQGEYGRILRSYRSRFPAEQVHTAGTADFGRDPGHVLDGVLRFLGLPAGYRPENLDARHYSGDARLHLDAEGEAGLRSHMKRRVWPRIADAGERAKAESEFDEFMLRWNATAEVADPPLSARGRERLETHYRADAELLAELGVPAPWLESWSP